MPERALRIRDALAAAGAPVVEAVAHGDESVLAVHDAGLVEFLREAWPAWEEAGLPDDPGAGPGGRVHLPDARAARGREAAVPASRAARTGLYAFDTMTPIGPGTWAAARAAADCALTAADLVLGGAPLAYACCRPPGHHVTRSAYGGSCYLNNAAIAAAHLRADGARRVAIVDVDAHHGNGAQAIFAGEPAVLTASVHVDPGAGWFPHFLGFGGESDAANLNVPLPPGTGDDGWLEAVARLVDAVREHGADPLVVALGVDAAAADPESPLRVSSGGYHAAGQLLGGLALPTVVVQEGGYDLAAIGGLVLAALTGLEEGLRA